MCVWRSKVKGSPCTPPCPHPPRLLPSPPLQLYLNHATTVRRWILVLGQEEEEGGGGGCLCFLRCLSCLHVPWPPFASVCVDFC